MDASQKGGNVVQVIYAAPFVLLSLVSCLICLAVPRFRRNALQAPVVSVAFGFCSIVGMLLILLMCDILTQRFHFDVTPGSLVGLKGILIGPARRSRYPVLRRELRTIGSVAITNKDFCLR